MNAAHPILIAGPTASGKSALALAVAERIGGMVINADSMQVYRDLRALTARPSAEEEARAPHRLYGHVPAREAYSVARWLEDVRGVLEEARRLGLRPVIVGGTGLYFNALTRGLSPIPPIPDEIRAHWRREAARQGPAGLHAVLAARDPPMAARLSPGDSQRIARALEVLEATGRSLGAWQQVAGVPLIDPAVAVRLVLRPARAELHVRCDHRFDLMVAGSALDEVRALAAQGLPPGLPCLGAIGVRPLMRHLAGALDLAGAVMAGKLETRQYVKRQETWQKRHMIAWSSITAIVDSNNASRFIHLIDD